MELLFEHDYGNGFVAVNAPANHAGIKIQLVFVNQHPNATVTGLDLEWVLAEAITINKYIAQGLTGGLGIYYGIGLRIYVQCGTGKTRIFDGYINLASKQTKIECDRVIAPSVETGKIDWLNDISASISFAVLAKLPSNQAGYISAADYKLTPYIIHDEAKKYVEEITLALGEFTILRETYDVICKIGQFIDKLVGELTTAIAQLGTSAATLLATVAMIILYIVYLIAIIVALINMTKKFIDNLFQLKKYKLTMRVEDSMRKIADYFNLGLSTTILQSGTYHNATICPRKIVMPDLTNPLNIFKRPQDESVNFPNDPKVYGHPDANCREWLKSMCEVFNANIVIMNNTLYYEEVHHFNNQAVFKIPATSPDGYSYNNPQPSGTNADSLPSNMFLSFQLDSSETNTLFRYSGTTVEYCVRPIITGNVKRLCRTNGLRVDFQYALAKRKDYLTKIENLLNNLINLVYGVVNVFLNLINGLLNAINNVISFFGGNSTAIPTIPLLPTNIVLNRLGWMELSDDSFGIPKLFIGEAQTNGDWVIASNNEADMSAYQLGERFHSKNLATRGNQQLTYRDKTFPLCCSDYNLLVQNNVVLDPQNRISKLEELTWNPHNEMAEAVSYSVFSNFDNNQQETVIIDGSQ